MKNLVENLPSSPGIYLFKNAKGQIIYIGKAKDLSKRIKSYFRTNVDSTKTRALVRNIDDWEVILTKTEVEALILERNLIKQHQPRYNIMLRDDKSFPLVRIDFNSPWPRVFKVRRRVDDGATYLGPFVSEGDLSRLMKAAYRIFPLIRCSEHEFKNARRPCNYYHMKMCLGPCSIKVPRDDYMEIVKNAAQFLQGKNKDVARDIEAQMLRASEREDYDNAALLRDQLFALKKAIEPQHVEFRNIESADAIGVIYDESLICIDILSVRKEKLVSNRKYHFDHEGLDDEIDELISQLLLQFYDRHAPPEQIFLEDELSNTEELEIALSQGIERKKTQLVYPKKGPKLGLLEIAQKNAHYHLQQQKLRQKKSRAVLEEVQKDLGLLHYPQVIECIDISNLQSEAIVASKVSFLDGRPNPAQYRHYNIKTTQGQDDFGSIYEVVSRRLRRGVEEDQLPNLLVIDGGKGQLSAAKKALDEYPGLDVELVSLAKKRVLEPAKKMGADPLHGDERIFKTDYSRPIILQPGSSAFRILTHLRDESHRFALTFHRQKRQKKAFESELDLIPGIGPKVRKKLLDSFGSVEKMQHATIEQLNGVKGVSSKLAETIHAWFRTETEEKSI